MNKQDSRQVNIILIGGIARVGKTTLVSKLLKELPYYTLSTDQLKYMGQQFGVMKDNSSSSDWKEPEKWLQLIRERDYEIWQWTKQYIISTINEHKSLIVEGNLWPDYIKNDIETFENVKLIKIFMVDTSSVDNIIKDLTNIQKTDEFNWLNKYNEEKIKQFANCNNFRSKKIKKLAKENNYLVYDINDFQTKSEMQKTIIEKIKTLL